MKRTVEELHADGWICECNKWPQLWTRASDQHVGIRFESSTFLDVATPSGLAMALRLGARAYQGEIDYADFPDIPQRQPGTSLENPS